MLQITGLISHNHHSSKFVPLYMQPRKQASEYIPSIFYRCQDSGYHIPDKVVKLIEKLLNGKFENNEHNREMNQSAKSNMIRIKETFEKSTHEECEIRKCSKVKIDKGIFGSTHT